MLDERESAGGGEGAYLLKGQLGVQVHSNNFTASNTNDFYGNQNLDDYGSFNASYDNLGELSSFSFSVQNNSAGINWATAEDVLTSTVSMVIMLQRRSNGRC